MTSSTRASTASSGRTRRSSARRGCATCWWRSRPCRTASASAIVLRELEGRSYDEIALALGVTDGAVRQLLNRARNALRAAAAAITPMPLLDAARRLGSRRARNRSRGRDGGRRRRRQRRADGQGVRDRARDWRRRGWSRRRARQRSRPPARAAPVGAEPAHAAEASTADTQSTSAVPTPSGDHAERAAAPRHGR